MVSWMHVICVDCWQDRNGNRQAVTINPPEKKDCCFCGRPTTSGIYIRENPKNLGCTHKGDP